MQSKENYAKELSAGDIFSPTVSSEDVQQPTYRESLKPVYYMMKETPFCSTLRRILNDNSKRLPSILEREVNWCYSKCIELIVIPGIFVSL